MLIACLSKLMLHTSKDRMFVNILLKQTDILEGKNQEYWYEPLVTDFKEMKNFYSGRLHGLINCNS
jgi:hypothetical protein